MSQRLYGPYAVGQCNLRSLNLWCESLEECGSEEYKCTSVAISAVANLCAYTTFSSRKISKPGTSRYSVSKPCTLSTREAAAYGDTPSLPALSRPMYARQLCQIVIRCPGCERSDSLPARDVTIIEHATDDELFRQWWGQFSIPSHWQHQRRHLHRRCHP